MTATVNTSLHCGFLPASQKMLVVTLLLKEASLLLTGGSAPFVRRRCDCLASSAPFANTLTYLLTYLFCHLASSFNRTVRLHTRQSWLKTGLLPTAVNSLTKINGLRTHLTSTLWTTMSKELCLNATSHVNPSRKTSMSSRQFCS